MNKGVWIALAGIDSAGKTTQLSYLQQALSELGYTVKSIAQLETDLGKHVRDILKLDIEKCIKPWIRALIFGAVNYRLASLVKSYLMNNDFVITDRSPYCAFAYLIPQGIPRQWIQSIYRYCSYPDITIFIDVPVQIALTRKKMDKTIPIEMPSFLERVRDVYMEMVRQGQIVYIDGTKSVKTVTNDIIKVVISGEKNEP